MLRSKSRAALTAGGSRASENMRSMWCPIWGITMACRESLKKFGTPADCCWHSEIVMARLFSTL
jgi:hypothetical protein